jgi:hypothetical protein
MDSFSSDQPPSYDDFIMVDSIVKQSTTNLTKEQIVTVSRAVYAILKAQRKIRSISVIVYIATILDPYLYHAAKLAEFYILLKMQPDVLVKLVSHQICYNAWLRNEVWLPRQNNVITRVDDSDSDSDSDELLNEIHQLVQF